MLDAENATCAAYKHECGCPRTYRYGEKGRINGKKA